MVSGSSFAPRTLPSNQENMSLGSSVRPSIRERRWIPTVTDSTSVTAFQHFAVVTNTKQLRVVENKEKLPWSVYLGVCGMPGTRTRHLVTTCWSHMCAHIRTGQTAHHAWMEFAHAAKPVSPPIPMSLSTYSMLLLTDTGRRSLCHRCCGYVAPWLLYSALHPGIYAHDQPALAGPVGA